MLHGRVVCSRVKERQEQRKDTEEEFNERVVKTVHEGGMGSTRLYAVCMKRKGNATYNIWGAKRGKKEWRVRVSEIDD